MDSTDEIRKLLLNLGLTEEQMTDFFAHIPVVYSLPTQSDPGIGLIHLIDDSRLRNGIVEINAVGGGLKSLAHVGHPVLGYLQRPGDESYLKTTS